MTIKRKIKVQGRTGRFDVPTFAFTQDTALEVVFELDECTSGVYRAFFTHGNAMILIRRVKNGDGITLSSEWLCKGGTEPVYVSLQFLNATQSQVIKSDYYIEPLILTAEENGYKATAEMSAMQKSIGELWEIVRGLSYDVAELKEQIKNYIDNGVEIFLPEEE